LAAGLTRRARITSRRLKWFRKAAEQGSGEGEYSLGYTCEKGLGVDANPYLAAELYKEAIQHNPLFMKAVIGLIDLKRRFSNRIFSESPAIIRSVSGAAIVDESPFHQLAGHDSDTVPADRRETP